MKTPSALSTVSSLLLVCTLPSIQHLQQKVTLLLNLENHPDTCILLNHARATCFKLCAHASSSVNPIERVTTVGCEDWGTEKDCDERLGWWREMLPSRRERNVWWRILLRVCMLEVLPGEQRNHMGWQTLRSACVVRVLQNGT